MTDERKEVAAQEQNEKPQQAKDLMLALTKMVEVSTKEQEVKQEELAVRRQEIESNEKIAMASIEAQKSFHADRWTKYNSHLIHRYIFVIVLLVVIFVFAGAAIYLGAKDLVIDVAKLASSLGLGAFGGYHWGKSKGKIGDSES